MATENHRRTGQGFRPVDNLDSAEEPTFALSPISNNMVNDREILRTNGSLKKTEATASATGDVPAFGTASPLRNPLKDRSGHIFYRPKPYQAHKEHHRSVGSKAVGSAGSQNQNGLFNPPYRNPTIDRKPSLSPEIVEIPRPSNLPHRPVLAAPRRLFSTDSEYAPANGWKPLSSNVIDLTQKSNEDEFNPDQALGIDKYSAFDPSNFLDVTQANENIKALLEGAFDDEGDKPKRKPQKKKQAQAADDLADKLDSLKVNDEAESELDSGQDIGEDDGSVEGLNIKLLPHQIDGLAWMLDKEVGARKKKGVLPKGGILADDMGLGKTIQALSLILSNRRPSDDDLVEKPELKIPLSAGKGTLIVAPLALIKQWESEIKTKVDTFPKLKVLVHHGPNRTKQFEDLKKYDIVITTYQTLTSEHGHSSPEATGLKAGCFGVQWFRVILDEAHTIKNRNAKMTKAAYDLEAIYRWCLTGTPMQNNLDELQSLIRFLRIKPYCTLANWTDQITQPMKNGRGGLALRRLQFFLKAFMKRRTKEVLKKEGGLNFGRANASNKGASTSNTQAKDTGFKIVNRKVEILETEFSQAEKEFYTSLEGRMEKNVDAMIKAMESNGKKDFFGALVLLLRLRQACDHPDLMKAYTRKEKEIDVPRNLPLSIDINAQKASAVGEDDMEDVASMFGALSVATKKCDGCGSKMNQAEIRTGRNTCEDCDRDFAKLQKSSAFRRSNRKSTDREGEKEKNKEKNEKKERTAVQSFKARNRRRIIDSDDEGSEQDEDDKGDWIVPEDQRGLKNLGQAGGKDDEDAEGGGRWLGADDSASETEESASEMDSFVEHDSVAPQTHKPNNKVSDHDSGNDESEASATTEDSESDSSADSDSDSDSFDGHHANDRAPSAKILRLLDILKAESKKHKFIVFSEFTSMLDVIEPFIHNAGFKFARYDGSMRNDEREKSLARLRNEPKVRILLCSLKCGSLGLNLTAASRVVIMEPFWNPFVEEQAIDRVHRLNQTQDVVVYRLTVADTVEQRILELQEKKRELAKAAIDGGQGASNLNMQDILSLFRRDAENNPELERMNSFSQSSQGGLLGRSPKKNGMSGNSTSPSRRPWGPTSTAQNASSSNNGTATVPKFTIPKSLNAEYDAYRRRDVFADRR